MSFQETEIALDTVKLQGLLTLPKHAKAIILFAHGSGSGRFSPRNQYVAGVLSQAGLATLLMDLFTPEEEQIDELTRQLRFDIPFLANRLVQVSQWVASQKEMKQLLVGYFGASTGAAAALTAAVTCNPFAIVSRGGRPDLALPLLHQIKAPTLLIIGGADHGVIELNQQAYDALTSEKKLTIVPNATHLFEENGALEQVAQLAQLWFLSHSQPERLKDP